jgi:GNAT superfamily N-acetyltransferase
MNHATLDNLEEIMDVFKQYKDVFPHIRSDKIERLVKSENVVWEENVLITYNWYKRKQKLGLIERSMFEGKPQEYVKLPYEAQEGDCILHQIAAKNQGDGSGKRVFERFLKFNSGRDIILSVRSENKRARTFYENYGFEVMSDIEWGKTKQVKGKVYVLDQKKGDWSEWTS